ncbi:uncharacterized protein LY89DRAFT_673936 [Mollisia scopiformis]|uniref:Uncharacterized protein n=1 Tax=Mollisia scopiformis TaxID=149040 RepID=A0A194WW08_MOLSC|nr:uncharacterized protein LY89DRAFT_673936 [Mollisia scopiformis]KUJ12155.1 hypothetical protein LY89DRAFT_673936 [Mollisia scopiformis]
MNPPRHQTFNWKGLPLDLKETIFDLMFEIYLGPCEPDKLEAFRGSEDFESARRIYHQKNKMMSPRNLTEWNELTRHQLNNIAHLYILLEDQDLVNLASLLNNPLETKNNLQSVILDVSRISTPHNSELLKIQNWAIIFSTIISLLEASISRRDVASKVSVLFDSAAGRHVEIVTKSRIYAIFKVWPTTSLICIPGRGFVSE